MRAFGLNGGVGKNLLPYEFSGAQIRLNFVAPNQNNHLHIY